MIETYVPLYRKYRPQDFHSLMGQEALAQTLSNALTLGRIAHAYLFTGPRGTGKTSTARILAKSLNCEQGPTLTPCQVCASCTGITNGNALDVIEFDAASNNGVDQARELIDSTRLAPLNGRFKIYIIDEVHMLSTQAFNALLKTLEEPPPNVVFIFATTEAHKVLPTIVSRCQRFDFQRIATGAIVDRLAWVCEREGLSADIDALTEIARHARGGLRDGLSLLDQVSVLVRAKADPTVHREDVLQFIGALGEDALLRLGEALATADTASLMTQLATWTSQGIEPSRIVKSLTQHFRHLLVVKSCQGDASADLLDLPAPYVESLRGQAVQYGVEEIPQILHLLAQLEVDLRKGSEPQLFLEVGLIGIAFRDKIFQVDRLLARIDALEARLGSGATPVVAVAQRPPASINPAVPQPAQSGMGPSLPPPMMPVAVAVSPSMPASLPAPVMPPSMPAPAASLSENAPSPFAPAPVIQQAPALAEPAASSATAGHEAFDVLQTAILGKLSGLGARALIKQNLWIVEADDRRIVFGCGSEGILKQATPNKIVEIEQAVKAHFGAPRSVQVRVEKKKDDVPASPVTAVPSPPAPSPSPAASFAEPVIQSVSALPARVVSSASELKPIEIDPGSLLENPSPRSSPASAPQLPAPMPPPSKPSSFAASTYGPVLPPSIAPPALPASAARLIDTPLSDHPTMEAPLSDEGGGDWDGPPMDDEGDSYGETPLDEPAAILTGDPAWQESKMALVRLLQGKILD